MHEANLKQFLTRIDSKSSPPPQFNIDVKDGPHNPLKYTPILARTSRVHALKNITNCYQYSRQGGLLVFFCEGNYHPEKKWRQLWYVLSALPHSPPSSHTYEISPATVPVPSIRFSLSERILESLLTFGRRDISLYVEIVYGYKLARRKTYSAVGGRVGNLLA